VREAERDKRAQTRLRGTGKRSVIDGRRVTWSYFELINKNAFTSVSALCRVQPSVK